MMLRLMFQTMMSTTPREQFLQNALHKCPDTYIDFTRCASEEILLKRRYINSLLRLRKHEGRMRTLSPAATPKSTSQGEEEHKMRFCLTGNALGASASMQTMKKEGATAISHRWPSTIVMCVCLENRGLAWSPPPFAGKGDQACRKTTE